MATAERRSIDSDALGAWSVAFWALVDIVDEIRHFVSACVGGALFVERRPPTETVSVYTRTTILLLLANWDRVLDLIPIRARFLRFVTTTPLGNTAVSASGNLPRPSQLDTLDTGIRCELKGIYLAENTTPKT